MSGDVHAAELIEQIRQREPDAVFNGLGGDRMAAAGCVLHQHIRHMAYMGFVAVLRHWKEIRNNFRIARQALLETKPDTLILIDYPSFNLRMAKFCRQHLPKTKIVYYIPPKVWAWKRRRIHKIARLCDEVLGIFPFEPEFYKKYGYQCRYVGNPTVEEITRVPRSPRNPRILALLPGSRESEIRHCLKKMLQAAEGCSGYEIVVCAAPGIPDAFYTPYLSHTRATLTRATHACVGEATAAIVNSGTATLETALLGCPQVAVYHLACAPLIGAIRWAQPLFFSIQHFTLVNIIEGKQVIKECIANEFTVDKVSAELNRLLHDEDYKKEMLASYQHLYSLLGDSPAAATAASIITAKR